LFLAVVIDLFSRQVVGWSLREDMTRDIVIDALRMAWFKRHPGKQAGLIFHSDRGSQYASHDFRGVLKEYGITSSMSRKGIGVRGSWSRLSYDFFVGAPISKPEGYRTAKVTAGFNLNYSF
jgi:hypothetical protein